jgi:uncharacterized protein YrzB (UPF0473 family)
MTNEAQVQQEDTVITLEGEDGSSHSCQLLNIFEFEGHDYALLLKLNEGAEPSENQSESEEGSLVIMRLVQRDDQSIFQTIESDEEFNKVVSHIEEMARPEEGETAES